MRRLQVPPSRYKPKDWKGHVWLFFRDVAMQTGIWLIYVMFALYKVFGAWWIEPWVDRAGNRYFAKELRQAMPFLFEIQGGTIVPSPRPAVEGHAEQFAYVEAGALLFRFSKWHDETLEPRVANVNRPLDTYKLDEILQVLKADGEGLLSKKDKNLRDYGEILKHHFDEISASLSESQINETRKKLAEMQSQRY